ncbi:MAG: hypothetical protein H8D56_07900 [Planctomycetes bacterium]|nr:hypothetical protein [Planctomycetota bacterium]MBL7145560.1 hypothetical protein [Phycisphaerae bacterium]
MAKITFNHAELLQILISNELLPKKILRPKVEGDEIHFVVETNLPLLQFVPVSLRYLSYADNNAIFEITVVNSSLNAMIGRLNLLSKLNAPAYVKFDFPKVSVDVNELLKEKNIRGVLIKDIIFNDGEFTIVTCST